MPEAKKTIIKIKDMDSPSYGSTPAVSDTKKKAKKTVESVDSKMRHKLANTLVENTINLKDSSSDNLPPKSKKSATKEEYSDKIDLVEHDFDDVASRMRAKLEQLTAKKAPEVSQPVSQSPEVLTANLSPEVATGSVAAGPAIAEAPAVVTAPVSTPAPATVSPFVVDPGLPPAAPERMDIPSTIKHHLPIGIYRKIATFFVLGTFALLVVVFYFTAVKMTVVVTPKQDIVSDVMEFQVAGTKEVESAVSVQGVVESVALNESQEFDATGERVIGEDAVGKVTIYNNYIKSQPLVASTRLLTPDGKLFRLKDTVNVPAGGSLVADIYADQASADLYVSPTKFTIPGLWAGLQDKIYGESQETIKYEQQVEKVVQQSDIDSAVLTLKKTLADKAKEEVGGMYQNHSRTIYKIDDSSITQKVSAKTGEKVDSFTVSMKASVSVVAFNDADVLTLAAEKIQTSLAGGQALTEMGDKAEYNLEDVSLVQKTAKVSATFQGKVAVDGEGVLVKRDNIIRLKEDQLNAYLSSLPELESYEIHFSPSWYRRAPYLVDRIEIKVK
jgi:hypothetical protein